MRRRGSINRWLTGLALVCGLTAGCARQYENETIEDPSVPLSSFGGVSVGEFSTGGFLDHLKGTPRYEHILAVVSGANRTVRRTVQARLRELRSADSGPPLLLTADLDGFEAAGGQGFMQYHVTLSSAGQPVASYNVRRKIVDGVKGAYEAEGDDIVRFLIDHQ